MVNIPLPRGQRQRRSSAPPCTDHWLPALERASAAADPDLGGLRRASRGSARRARSFAEADYAWVTRELVGVAQRARAGPHRVDARRRLCAVRARPQRRRAHARARSPHERAAPSQRERPEHAAEVMDRRSSCDAALSGAAAALARCRRWARRAPPALRARAARRHPRRADPRARARGRDQLRLPVSVRRDAVLPAQAAGAGRRRRRRCAARTATTYAWHGGVGPRAQRRRVLRDLRAQARLSDARGLVHPLPAQRSATSDAQRHPLLRRPQRLRSRRRARAWSRARRRSRSPRSCSSTTPRATSSARSARVGAEQFDAFFEKYEIKLALEYGEARARKPVGGDDRRARARRSTAARRSSADAEARP